MTAVNYLNSMRPGTKQMAPLDKPIEPSKAEKVQYNRILATVNNPISVLEHVKAGTITPQDVQTIKTVYPGLYKSLSQKIMDNVVDVKTKGQDIPYKTRMGLSMFLGTPLDSTFAPTSIIAAQPKPPQAQPQTPMQPASNPKRSTNSLNKLPTQYQTPGQAAESRRAGRD